MTDDPLDAALQRLERAVSRIEAAGLLVRAPDAGLSEAYAALDDRHGILRLRVQETIDRLDTLIGEGGSA